MRQIRWTRLRMIARLRARACGLLDELSCLTLGLNGDAECAGDLSTSSNRKTMVLRWARWARRERQPVCKRFACLLASSSKDLRSRDDPFSGAENESCPLSEAGCAAASWRCGPRTSGQQAGMPREGLLVGLDASSSRLFSFAWPLSLVACLQLIAPSSSLPKAASEKMIDRRPQMEACTDQREISAQQQHQPWLVHQPRFMFIMTAAQMTRGSGIHQCIARRQLDVLGHTD